MIQHQFDYIVANNSGFEYSPAPVLVLVTSRLASWVLLANFLDGFSTCFQPVVTTGI